MIAKCDATRTRGLLCDGQAFQLVMPMRDEWLSAGENDRLLKTRRAGGDAMLETVLGVGDRAAF